MIEIEKPKMVTSDVSEDGRYGKFVWEPLERGYGITLGNSLRRVLLSSLPGAAVTYVKIDGVLHEFATIPGVREDVADIILNIKALCLKMEGEGEKILRIECSGEQEVTAANIIADSDVEILNPELHIATLDKDAVFNMEIHLETPRVAASERGPMAKPSSGHTRQGFRRRGCRAAHPGAAAPGRRSGWGAERHGRAGRSG